MSTEIEQLKQRLAASQAREMQLREFLRGLPETLIAEQPEWDMSENNGVIWKLYLSRVCGEALALQQDTTAIESMIAKAGEVMRERCARCCEIEAHERFNEWGTREHDTGAAYYHGSAAEELEARDEEDEVCAQGIRALPGVTLEDLK